MSALPAPRGRPSTPWLRDLHDELMTGAREEVNQCCKVAILLSAKMPRAEIAARLGLEHREVEAAIRKLRDVRADDRPEV